MFVQERFELQKKFKDHLRSLKPDFGYNGFGEAVFYRTYSRQTKDGRQETWGDVVCRVIEGTMSIRQDHYMKNRIEWNNKFWTDYAHDMAISMFWMEWLPPGRGLWAMGTDFVYERGAMPLYNCAYTDIHADRLSIDCAWIMDVLMQGVGVGFGPHREDNMKLYPIKDREKQYILIPDSREGWTESVRMLLLAYLDPKQPVPEFDYSVIRPYGQLIRGFGGISSGPEPLIELHKQILMLCDWYIDGKIDSVKLKADLANCIGCCVVAGNVRRSAEIACGPIDDETFLNLKDYDVNMYRCGWGWMSNNSVTLQTPDDFERLGEIARRVVKNGEPGYMNLMNFPMGRIGKFTNVPKDPGIGLNPCGEVILCSKEVCNISETIPTKCESSTKWMQAAEFATVYCSTVSLLPTNHSSTNQIVARNRRIGVSIIDVSGWIHEQGMSKVIRHLRDGYARVTSTNKWVNGEAGVPEAIRKTTVKPGGTVPKLPGKTSGMTYPLFHHTLRRMRVQQDSPMFQILHEAGYPHEPDVKSKFTEVFEFPILQGPAKEMSKVSLWEQAMLLVMLQREWADNAVSNTLNFRPAWPMICDFEGADLQVGDEYFITLSDGTRTSYPNDDYHKVEHYTEAVPHKGIFYPCVRVYKYDPNHEEDIIEQVLSSIAPLTKSVALLPHTQHGVYPQMPESGISEQEYNRRLAALKPIDWSKFTNSDGEDEKYCGSQGCEIKSGPVH